MKIPFAISLMILAAAAVIGWQIDGRLAAARTVESKLATEAARLGIPAGDAHATRSATRVRMDRAAEARLLAVEYIQLALQLAQASAKGGKLDETSQKHYRDCYACISALDASSLKILIADVLASQDLAEKKRTEEAVYLLRMNLASKHPRAALEFVTEHSAALKNAKDIEGVISGSLGTWAKDDPIAAVEWMKTNAVDFPDAMNAQSRHNVFNSAALKDPRLAFTLIATLGLVHSNIFEALHSIVTSAATDEQRNATLAALREFRDANQGDKEVRQAAEQMVGYFSRGFKQDVFKSATQWIASANLSPNELGQFCNNLSSNYRGDESAQWIEWMGKTFPPGTGDPWVSAMIRNWTNQDYEAAGKWLVSAPEGPVKNAAISSYAWTIFEHDPETAMQWIMTLPPGRDRDNTLKTIYINWPKDDSEGAASFAKEHGIK